MSLVSEHVNSTVEESLDWPAGLWGEVRTIDLCQQRQKCLDFPSTQWVVSLKEMPQAKPAAELELPVLIFIGSYEVVPVDMSSFLYILVFFETDLFLLYQL